MLAAPAKSACTRGGPPLNLLLPSNGDSGSVWAPCLFYDMGVLSTATAVLTSTSMPAYFASVRISTAFYVGSSLTITTNVFTTSLPVTVSSSVFVGISVTTQTAGGAGVSVTALCDAGTFATGGGCSCTGGISVTGETGEPNCLTKGCVPTGWTCSEPGGTGGACAARVICSRLR